MILFSTTSAGSTNGESNPGFNGFPFPAKLSNSPDRMAARIRCSAIVDMPDPEAEERAIAGSYSARGEIRFCVRIWSMWASFSEMGTAEGGGGAGRRKRRNSFIFDRVCKGGAFEVAFRSEKERGHVEWEAQGTAKR